MSFCGALQDRCAKTVSSHALCSGSGSSALLRCPASASALERALRLADRGAKTASSYALCSGSGSSALLRCPASASALDAGLASCRPRRQNSKLVRSLFGQRKQRPLAVPCIRFGPWCGPRVLQTAAPKQQAHTLSVRAAEAVPSCGALHPLRPLSGPRVLQTAAPKIPPCFRRRRRSGF